MAQVSANIERLTANEFDKAEVRAAQPVHIEEKVIEIEPLLTESVETLTSTVSERAPFSQFASSFEPLLIRVTISTKGLPRNLIETVESRIVALLNARAPQPFELRKSASIDRYDKVWGHLHIDYQRQMIRLRRSSKTSPLRASYKFFFDMHLTAGEGKVISWHNWTYKWQDENTVANEAVVNAHFWKQLESEMPLLTSIDEEETAQWLRAQGLSPRILSGDLNAMSVSDHQYYPNGCVVETGDAASGNVLVRQLSMVYAPPQQLSVTPLLMRCQPKATFVVASESATRIALYYHPDNTGGAWKSVLNFQSQVRAGDLAMFLDDALICLYTGNEPQQARFVEFQCLDRKTGILKWRIAPVPGALRGFASTQNAFYIATDQAMLEVLRDGRVSGIQKLETGNRQKRYLSCQFDDRMVFSTSSGHLVSYRFDTREIDWETVVLEPSLVHCSPHGPLLVSEVGGYLLAFDIADNKPLWKYRTVATPKDIMTYGGVIYILLDRGIVAIDSETGQTRAQIPLHWAVRQFIPSGARLYLDSAKAVYTWK